MSFQEPMPALALAHDYNYDDSGNDSQEDMTSQIGSMHPKSTQKLNTLSPNARHYSASLGSGGGSGGTKGGSGGRHKCPKCGMTVTFKHTDFEENTFYCASCSGWFLVKNSGGDTEISQPVPHGHGNGGGYLEFKDAREYSGKENGGSVRTHVSITNA